MMNLNNTQDFEGLHDDDDDEEEGIGSKDQSVAVHLPEHFLLI